MLPDPYLFTSERTIALVDRPYSLPGQGPVADSVYGYHTLWIAEVPFIQSEGARDFTYETEVWLRSVIDRQKRFLYDLAQSRSELATFELRFISWPQERGPTQVGIAFLGKVFHQDYQISRLQARLLWEKFSAVFPRETPYSYPLVAVQEQLLVDSGQTHSFAQWYQPWPFSTLTAPASVVELRKYEDWPLVRDIGGTFRMHDYIPHPFEPALDYSALARLFETLTRQRRVCLVAVTVRPQPLTSQELLLLHEMFDWYQRITQGRVHLQNPLADVLRELHSTIFDTALQTRAALGLKVYENLLQERENLVSVRLQVIGRPEAPDDLVEALGSEVTAGVGGVYPSRWARVAAMTPQELRWASFNARWLEFARWGISALTRQVPDLIRLRQLATVAEAVGAFRLPVAFSGRGLAGIDVRDEPFALPLQTTPASECLSLGWLQDRGVRTLLPCTLPVEAFAGGICLLGERGAARHAVLSRLCAEMEKMGIPWIILCRAGSQKAARIVQAPCIHLEAAQPSCLQPFLPPAAVPLADFLDALQRVLARAYHFEPAVCVQIYRVLTETYTGPAWQGQIDLRGLVDRIDKTLQESASASPGLTDLCVRGTLLLRSLALTAEQCFSSDPLCSAQWTTPLVIEMEPAGGDLNQAMLAGWLWSWFALALSTRPASAGGLRAIVGIEDMHLLFSPSPSVTRTEAVPTVALLRIFAQQGVGTLLIDERPDLLDSATTGSAGVMILTRTSNSNVHTRMAHLLNADQRQQARMRHLGAQEAIVKQAGESPVLILTER
jgi:hypothetical protein